MIKDAFRFALIVGVVWLVCYFLQFGHDEIYNGVSSSWLMDRCAGRSVSCGDLLFGWCTLGL